MNLQKICFRLNYKMIFGAHTGRMLFSNDHPVKVRFIERSIDIILMYQKLNNAFHMVCTIEPSIKYNTYSQIYSDSLITSVNYNTECI